ncbi:hypothetical protein [Zobellia galactanivorans]|uniref:Uncharacterized protein n=1 Tax=Zobellia galactanivorans (strain DSM 12802 / CCUG 47099 / CIP 106680 / NCIMB 13871 / Dsij) TaxID=63186 RepID=G0L6C0_ZOBGA|nr:hypothetical protein [Zobellia galactanivorans]CAZ96837.1 Putative protein [Zobellia galactanivorans]
MLFKESIEVIKGIFRPWEWSLSMIPFTSDLFRSSEKSCIDLELLMNLYQIQISMFTCLSGGD